jgi:hypothetical protein
MDDGLHAVVRRTRHGCQGSRPATGFSCGLDTSPIDPVHHRRAVERNAVASQRSSNGASAVAAFREDLTRYEIQPTAWI